MMIDILMATYNGEAYLNEQLKSIENQTWKRWRLTVCDDGSTDGTWDILEQFQRRIGEDRVVILKNNPPTGSAKKNFIQMIQACQGEYMMCCDQDDVWHPDKIEKTFRRMYRMEKRYGKELPLMVHTDLRVVDAELKELHPSFHAYMNLRTDGKLNYELTQNQVTGCTMMINRYLQAYVQPVKNLEAIVMHDHWLALTALVFGKLSYLNQATIDYRQHCDNSVGAQDAKSLAYMWQRFRRGKTKFRQDMMDSSTQSEYFLHIYASCIDDKKMVKLLDKYAFVYKKCKIIRVFVFIRCRFLKKGVIRKVMQIFWG